MTFDQWLEAKGFGGVTLTEAQRATLNASYKAEQEKTKDPPADDPARTAIEAARAREQRLQEIGTMISAALDAKRINADTAEHISLKANAENWDRQRAELELLRAERPQASALLARPRQPDITDAVIEASVCRAAGLQDLEKSYDARTLEAANQHFPRGMHLSDLIMHYARRGGYSGQSIKASPEAAMRAARRASDIQAAGSWGPSTQGASIGSMLAAVANKFFRAAFESVDSSWREIAARRSTPDFKQITTYSLTGDLTFKKLPPGGEIQHGQVDATSYTNQVDTYARMLGLDRRDIINDDIGAFTSIARRMGRGGALALNKLFWGIFLNNSSFFTAGRNNLITGGGTTLQLSQLDALNQKFLTQTDPDGNILGVRPAILLVPPALEATAKTLMASTMLASGATTAPGTPSTNIWAGMFRVVSSPYMQDSTLTGNSSTAWYLIADPNDLPVIEVAFLNGNETPTVEPIESDPSMLGQGFRGYFDVGVAFQEYRAGAKSAGA